MLDEDAIISHLFTLGEIAQLCPRQTPPRVFMLVQSLIAAATITSVGRFTHVFPMSCCCELLVTHVSNNYRHILNIPTVTLHKLLEVLTDSTGA